MLVRKCFLCIELSATAQLLFFHKYEFNRFLVVQNYENKIKNSPISQDKGDKKNVRTKNIKKWQENIIFVLEMKLW